MWVKNLPTYCKAHISDQTFDKDSYKKVFDMTDKCWQSHKNETPAVAAIKEANAAALKDSTDMENPAVAAIRRGGGANSRGWRGGRGGGGQNRGGGNSQNRGGQNNSNRGGGRGGKKPLGPRHPQAVEGSCYVHHQYGPEAWSCADRHNCPMRDIENPKPKHNRNIPIEK